MLRASWPRKGGGRSAPRRGCSRRNTDRIGRRSARPGTARARCRAGSPPARCRSAGRRARPSTLALVRAKPKSTSTGVPSGRMITLRGDRSRWTSPAACSTVRVEQRRRRISSSSARPLRARVCRRSVAPFATRAASRCGQGLPLDELHGVPADLLVALGPPVALREDAHHAGMADLAQGVDLPVQREQGLAARRLHRLDGDLLAGPVVDGAVHDADPAAPQHRHHPEGAEAQDVGRRIRPRFPAGSGPAATRRRPSIASGGVTSSTAPEMRSRQLAQQAA